MYSGTDIEPVGFISNSLVIHSSWPPCKAQSTYYITPQSIECLQNPKIKHMHT